MPPTQVATTTTSNSPLDTEVARMTEMLEKLVAVLARPYRRDGILLMSGEHPVGPVDWKGGRALSPCHLPTAWIGYLGRSRLADTTWTLRGDNSPLRGKTLAAGGSVNHGPNSKSLILPRPGTQEE